MHTWHWQTWQDLPYLTCSLLKSWHHGFFTQHFSPRLPAQIVGVLQPGASVYRVKQVHGNTVLTSSEVESVVGKSLEDKQEVKSPEADGVMTEQSQQAVWVCTADCTPVLIADQKTGQVAAVHAGWRGTADCIVPKAIARLQSQKSSLENLRIAMGPAIAGEVYQVSETVAAQVGATVVSSEIANGTKAILDSLRQLPNPPILDDPQPGRARLDVRRINALQLEQLGISPEQIAIAPHCTYQEPEHFFSYRRNKLKKVQWSGIVSA